MSYLTLIAKLNGRDSMYRCKCGSIHTARTNNVDIGKCKSCGCLRKEGRPLHGLYGTPIYAIWNSMIGRCRNPNNQAFADYGGRGITVCEGWNSVVGFHADMGDPPKGLTLDRKDNSKGYCKENCRWVSMKEQQNNKRGNVVLEFRGEKLNVTQWAERLGIPRMKIYGRIKAGWTVERALESGA